MDIETIKQMSSPDTIQMVLKLYPRSVFVLSILCAIVMMACIYALNSWLAPGLGTLFGFGFIFYRLYLTAFARLQGVDQCADFKPSSGKTLKTDPEPENKSLNESKRRKQTSPKQAS